ncbi:FkbM family methyltransferase [Mesorhizobium shangrilense]|uniref:FkbM family methyltransferase n=1 Tax=Mesorhizobium shangrilense TaxID=460060 RepID=A0ABV2DCN9_9HYPH
MQKILAALGAFAAPAAYFAGRAIGSPALSALSVQLDHHYLRGYASKLQSENVKSEMFSRFSQAAKLCASGKKAIDNELIKVFPMSHGQLLQDVVCMVLHEGKRDGYFVEIGVGDGTKYSNTLMLERDFGWRGVLAEPAAMFHDSISKSRAAILDRRAVSDKTGDTLVFQQDNEVGELSGFAGAKESIIGKDISRYIVDTISFDDLMDEHGAPNEIDYVSIDTEGSELLILDGMSMKKRNISFITIEHNFSRKRIKDFDTFFYKNGYRRILKELSQFDCWYVINGFADDVY